MEPLSNQVAMTKDTFTGNVSHVYLGDVAIFILFDVLLFLVDDREVQSSVLEVASQCTYM